MRKPIVLPAPLGVTVAMPLNSYRPDFFTVKAWVLVLHSPFTLMSVMSSPSLVHTEVAGVLMSADSPAAHQRTAGA